MTARRSAPSPSPTPPGPAAPPWRQTVWRLAHDPRSPGHARALLREQSLAWGLPSELSASAVLLLSELVTNACRHARPLPGQQVAVRCTVANRTVRVEVDDGDAELPYLRRVSANDESGRGLALVACVAHAWGAHPRGRGVLRGKTVWFELRLPPDPPATVTSVWS